MNPPLSELRIPAGTPLRPAAAPPAESESMPNEPATASPRRPGSRLRGAKKHARLLELEELQKSQPDVALLSLRRTMEHLTSNESVEADPALTFGVASALVSSSVARDEFDGALEPIETAVSRLRNDPFWQDAGRRAARQYLRMVDFERMRGDENEAINLFGRARRLSPQDDSLIAEMTHAAAALDRSDLEIAELYLSFLESRPADAALKETVLKLLRRGLRVDLARPSADRLPLVRELGRRLLKIVPRDWCAAVEVGCELRAGQLARASALTEQYAPGAESEEATWTTFALTAYRRREWAKARALLDGAALAHQTGRANPDSAWSGLREPLGAMLVVNEALYGVQTLDWAALDETVETLESLLPTDDHAVDGRWLIGAGQVLLGRDREAVHAFQSAPAAFRAWRFAEIELQAHAQLGAEDELLRRLEALTAATEESGLDAEAAVVAALAAARLHLRRNRESESRRLIVLAGTHLAPDSGPDPDLTLAQWCLQAELSQRNPTATAAPPNPPAEGTVSAPVAAWRDRILARQAPVRGEFGRIAALRDAPAQRFVPDGELDHLRAVELALQHLEADEADRLFASAAAHRAAVPEHRLARALWRSSREPSSAGGLLAEILAETPDCLEARLAAFSLEVSAALETAAATESDPSAPLSTPALDDIAWEAAPLSSIFRPWFALLPTDVWGQALPLSPHRVADMLFAADELLKARRPEEALALTDRIRSNLADRAPVCDPWLAARMRKASLILFGQGKIPEACEVHRRTPDCDGDRSAFPEALARSLLDSPQSEASAPDEALDVWSEWLSKQPAGDVPQGPAVRALERFLRVDERADSSLAEAERRATRCEVLAAARPEWDWPVRNLARARRRQGRGQDALEYLTQLKDPRPDDFRLRGQILWEHGEFVRARDAFRQAAAAAPDNAEILFWKAMAEAATHYSETVRVARWPAPADLEPLVADLHPVAAPAESVDLARVWYGSVLIAAGREAEAIDPLSRVEGDDHRNHARALLRLAHAQRRDFERAIAPDEASGNDEQALQLWIDLRRAGRAHRAAAIKRFGGLVRTGIEHPAWELCQAFVAAVEGKRDRALRILDSATRVDSDDPDSIVLRPLGRFLEAERRWLSAHVRLIAGERLADDALDFGGPEISRDAARFVAARDRALQRDWNSAAEMLNDILERDPSHVDALGLLAHVALRNGNLPEARRRIAEVRRIESAHPQAALTEAGLKENEVDTGDESDSEEYREDARRLYEEVWQQNSSGVELRERGHAALALGRLAEANRQWDVARDWYEKAAGLNANGRLPRQRLAMLLVRTTEDAQSLQEASSLLEEDDGPRTMQAGLARAVLAWKRRELKQAADAVHSLLDSPQFPSLPVEARPALLEWAATLLFREKRFEPATRALTLLLEEADPERHEELAERRDACRMQAVLARLRRGPLTDDVVDEARVHADEIAASRPTLRQAATVGVLCRVLVARGELPADLRARIDQLEALGQNDPALKLFVGLIRENWLGDEATVESNGDSAHAAASAEVHHCVRLLKANRSRQLQPLLDAADALQSAEGRADAARLPFAAHDLVRLAALHEIAAKKETQAMERLSAWRQASAEQVGGEKNGDGKAISDLLSRLWARQAAAELKADELEQARESLGRAVRFLTGADV